MVPLCRLSRVSVSSRSVDSCSVCRPAIVRALNAPTLSARVVMLVFTVLAFLLSLCCFAFNWR